MRVADVERDEVLPEVRMEVDWGSTPYLEWLSLRARKVWNNMKRIAPLLLMELFGTVTICCRTVVARHGSVGITALLFAFQGDRDLKTAHCLQSLEDKVAGTLA